MAASTPIFDYTDSERGPLHLEEVEVNRITFDYGVEYTLGEGISLKIESVMQFTRRAARP